MLTYSLVPASDRHALVAADIKVLTNGEAAHITVSVVVKVALAGPQLRPGGQLVVPAQRHHIRRGIPKHKS